MAEINIQVDASSKQELEQELQELEQKANEVSSKISEKERQAALTYQRSISMLGHIYSMLASVGVSNMWTRISSQMVSSMSFSASVPYLISMMGGGPVGFVVGGMGLVAGTIAQLFQWKDVRENIVGSITPAYMYIYTEDD